MSATTINKAEVMVGRSIKKTLKKIEVPFPKKIDCKTDLPISGIITDTNNDTDTMSNSTQQAKSTAVRIYKKLKGVIIDADIDDDEEEEEEEEEEEWRAGARAASRRRRRDRAMTTARRGRGGGGGR